MRRSTRWRTGSSTRWRTGSTSLDPCACFIVIADELGLAHKGEAVEWDEVAKTGVQHFKMVLPEDGSEYKWATDPELKEVRKLNLFDYSKKFVMVRGRPPSLPGSGYSAVICGRTQ